MTTTTVANQSGLLTALANAQGGDTIILKDGNYGSLRLTNDYASTVTIKAEHSLGASISTLQAWGATNLKFDGIEFDSGMNGSNGRGVISIENYSKGISVVNSEVKGSVDGVYAGHYGIYVRNGTDVVLQNNNVHDVDSGIVIFGGVNVDVGNNSVDYVGRDAMKYSGLSNASIHGNHSNGHYYTIGSVHNDFIQFEGDSSNVSISDNWFLPSTIASVQGIFMADGTYSNITIEDNLIYTGMLRGISVSAGSGIKINDNTLLNVPDLVHNGTTIFAPAGSSVNNNIMMSYSGGTAGSNLILQNSNPNAAYYVDDYFANADKGLGASLADLSPVAGSLATSKGAAELLASLLGGSTPTTSSSSSGSSSSGSTGSSTGSSSAGSTGDDHISINAGGSSYLEYDADSFYFGGSTYKTSAAIAGTQLDPLYQTERYGNFSYDAAVDNGTYAVTLKFAEIYLDGAGQRLFDVKAEGKLVLDNYDIFAHAGGKNIATQETFNVTVTDGQLDLDFISVRENAKVSAIDIDHLV